MDQYAKDVIDAATKCIGLLTVFAAIFTAWHQFNKSREERIRNIELREDELRWRRASLAREVLNELWSDDYCINAMYMLDWSLRHYELKNNEVTISKEEVWSALRVTHNEFDDKEKYVRDCFDNFFGMMQIIEHYINIKLISFDDVTYPFSYYAKKLRENKEGITRFLTYYEYKKALHFLQRFESWESENSCVVNEGVGAGSCLRKA